MTGMKILLLNRIGNSNGAFYLIINYDVKYISIPNKIIIDNFFYSIIKCKH